MSAPQASGSCFLQPTSTAIFGIIMSMVKTTPTLSFFGVSCLSLTSLSITLGKGNGAYAGPLPSLLLRKAVFHA